AILAEAVSGNGGGGLRGGRFVRLPHAPGTAGPPLTLLPAVQKRGVWRILLLTPVETGRARGGLQLCAPGLPDNEPIKVLLRSLDEHATARIEDGLLVYELALPEPSHKALAADPIYRLLKLSAEGLQIVTRSLAAPLKRVASAARAQRGTDPQ